MIPFDQWVESYHGRAWETLPFRPAGLVVVRACRLRSERSGGGLIGCPAALRATVGRGAEIVTTGRTAARASAAGAATATEAGEERGNWEKGEDDDDEGDGEKQNTAAPGAIIHLTGKEPGLRPACVFLVGTDHGGDVLDRRGFLAPLDGPVRDINAGVEEAINCHIELPMRCAKLANCT